ncbi:flagellum-specific ATP synthase FliI, partial [Rhizobium leguminosarum]
TEGLDRRSISNTAPPSMTRKRVETGFNTGVRAIDIFSPLCLGQRLGIFAVSGVGKSTLLATFADERNDNLVEGIGAGEHGQK